MAVEAKRGCGYRKVGGLYMVSGELSQGLPILELHQCPVCNSGVKQTRGFQWIRPQELFRKGGASYMAWSLPEEAGLLWIGAGFYPTAESFIQEAMVQGISRRISAVPKDFEVGKDTVMFAHPKAIIRAPNPGQEDEIIEAQENVEKGAGYVVVRAGIVAMFVPTRIEKIITETMSRDEELVADLVKRNITPVIVPDDDLDHQGSVHDKEAV